MKLQQSMPHPVRLRGDRVFLDPFREEDIPELLTIGQDHVEEFRHTSTPVTEQEAEDYFGTLTRAMAEGDQYGFTIRLSGTDEIIGMTRFSDLDFPNRRTYLGYTWLRPDQFGTATNVESKYLMLAFMFEELRFHRVAIRTDVNNERSRRAIVGLGAKFEGILRRHMVVREGRVRDTALYAVTDEDWPEVRGPLLEKVRSRL
ncbi:MAG TPA: GNAT family protein [Deinococcales bacterium]|nr:GNAT family protein [Deinococcales bacterium]